MASARVSQLAPDGQAMLSTDAAWRQDDSIRAGDVQPGSINMAALARELEDVGECAGCGGAAAVLAHAAVARDQVGQPEHNAEPDHHKQCHQPLHARHDHPQAMFSQGR